MYRVFLSIILVMTYAATVCGEGTDEIPLIKKTALNYMEAWYQGNATTMKACLHKKLSKRSFLLSSTGRKDLRHTTASDMISYTKGGYGKSLFRKDQKIEVIVLDYYKNIASVKVITPHYYEYLHLGKMDDKWLILNALYENKSPKDD